LIGPGVGHGKSSAKKVALEARTELPDHRPRGEHLVTVIATILGLGFQAPPDDERGIAGYVDPLHQKLNKVLWDQLGDDSYRLAHTVQGLVFVHRSRHAVS
jgi:hypothetical protein